MAKENLRLVTPNVTRVDGYFYTIIDDTDTLFKMVDDGNAAFSYPLDTALQNPVASIEHDGYFFWTLENPTSGVIIRKWKISDFILKQVRKYEFTNTVSQKYDSNAFGIEHFHRTFSGTASVGDSLVDVNDSSRVSPGDHCILGPSTFPGDEGKLEEIVVASTPSSTELEFSSDLLYSYNPSDPISISKRVWFFNKFRPSDPDPVNGSGQLFSFDIDDLVTTLIPRVAGSQFKDVKAATYLKEPIDNRDYLVYANQTNLLFIETEDTDPDFKNTVRSAAQNNQQTNSTVIPIHEITHENNTIFRLQLKATFQTGTSLETVTWSEYNYQLAPLQRLPNSISMTASPAVIAAEGHTSTSTITAIVKDQFDDPVIGRTVNFSEDDTSGAPAGDMLTASSITNSSGEATNTYRAGTIAKLVTITAET